jgi:NADP-dependent 3-hydroxy acid dehydrogenase YdfG
MTSAPGNLLVFGARNLGRDLAAHFATLGWKVAGVARSAETVAAFEAAVPTAFGIRAAAGEPGEAERAFVSARAALGGHIDLVVNAISPALRGASYGTHVADADLSAIDPYVKDLIPAIFDVTHVAAAYLGAEGRGTLIQVTGGSSRRGMPGRGPWAAGAFATRGLFQAVAQELREHGVHAALLVVDAVIESVKTAAALEGKPAAYSTTGEDVAAAVAYLHGQSPRGWTHELTITPAGDRWVP